MVNRSKCFIDQFYFTFNPVAPLLKYSAISEVVQKKKVLAGSPIALQCELSDATGQVSWYKDGTKLHPQSGVDFQSEGNLRSLVVPSAEEAHTGVYRCESKDDDIQFAVEVKGDAQKLYGAFTVLHCQLTVTAVRWIKSCLSNHLTENGYFFYFPNMDNYFFKNVK